MPKLSRKKTLKLNIINFCKLPRQCFGSIGNRLFGSNNTTKSSKSKKKRRNSLNSLSTYQKPFVQLNINNNNNNTNNNNSCNSLIQLKENLIKNYNYSSNEEEKSENYDANDDDLTFYDAIEYLDSNSTDIFFDIKSLNNSINRQTTLDSFHTTQTAQIIKHNNKSSIDSLIFNEDTYEEEQLDFSTEKSLITHFLGQLRIGMDLERIAMPAFILESRSMLEMYADFYLYTDLFLKVTELTCPHERIKQLLRWYIATFRTCRKNSLAKKPYNPVLGELFECWYNTNENEITGAPSDTKLKFLAEQVSHHPPVSAFYLEHPQKRIQLDGYSYTKSKFLGLYASIETVGRSCVTLLNLDEEYIITFPSCNVRSILTMPWLEMIGTTSITCAKTGYSATINFMPKPFYGGKRHMFTASIQGPDKKLLDTIDGDWSGDMVIKTGSNKEPFIDFSSLTRAKKQLRSLADQNDNESRKLWQNVTRFLRNKEIQSVADEKHSIEEKQREIAKQRKDMNIEWLPKHFHEFNGHWCFNEPLLNKNKNNKN